MLKIFKAKPNPDGKDKFDGVSPVAKQRVAGEWVDIKNESLFEKINLDGLELCVADENHEAKLDWKIVFKFPVGGDFALGPEKTVRIHAGDMISQFALLPEDRDNADFHLYTQSGYFLHNKLEQHIGLWCTVKEKWIDRCHYEAYPPEGEILYRTDGKLSYKQMGDRGY